MCTCTHNSFIKKGHYLTNYNYPLKTIAIIYHDECKCTYLYFEYIMSKMQY